MLAIPAASFAQSADGGSQATADAQPADAGAPAEEQPAGGELEFFKLEEVMNQPVVTASGGVAEEKSLAAANVVVITREEIARHGWRSLAAVLSSVPGLYVINDLVQPSVGVRGVTGGLRAGTRVVKVMINGVAVNFRPELNAMIG